MTMKVLILGLGKSGTTGMVYKVAGGLPNCHAFSGGKPGKYTGNYENAVYKHTYEERKGKNFEVYRKHFANFQYDRKVWMARDPRDAAVSRVLYRFHKGILFNKKQYQTYFDLILKKEQNPAAVPFIEICRYASHLEWPASREKVVEEERIRYARMRDFVKRLGDDWFLFKYEDMVTGRFDAVNRYLGFSLKSEAEVPKGTGKDKVVRKKAFGDWRHWFTPEDAALFKPAYRPYMEAIGYDTEDWELASEPVIEPQFSSAYVKNLASKGHSNILKRFYDNLMQRYYART
jgi:hypothetical protein